MAAFSLLLFVLLGTLAGFSSGLIGIGGGVILVPALVILFDFPQHMAQGTTLALMVPPIGILAAWSYFRSGQVDLRVAACMCVGFIAGGFVGAKFAFTLSELVLQRVFGVAMSVVALRMLFTADKYEHCELYATPIEGWQFPLFIVLGFVAGAASGILGIGGGVLLVPGLIFLFGMSQHRAQGTTLAMMVPPIGALAAWQYYQQGDVDVLAGAMICVGFVVGALLGANFASRMSSKVLSQLFGLSMLAIALKMLFAF